MKLIIVGKSAAGKDYLKGRLAKRGFKSGVSHTTRPPRENEIDGENYHFVAVDKFKTMINLGLFIEYVEFNGWYYGQTKREFNNADVVIMSRDGLYRLPAKYREECVVVYLKPPTMVRLERLKRRADTSDGIIRRMNADDEQYEGFIDFDMCVTNSDF